MLITSGSQQLLYMLTECLCDSGDIVLVEGPTYFVYLGIVQSHDFCCRGIRLAPDGIDLSHLPGPEAAAERLVRLVEEETAPAGRFTLSSWIPHGEQMVPVPRHEGALQPAERVPR